jgi:hypothetical protein
MQAGDIIALIEAIALTARSLIGIIPKLVMRRNGVTIPTSIDRALGITISVTISVTTTTNAIDPITDTAPTATTILVATTVDILST